MALEPKVVSLEGERNPELEDMSRRFWICLGPSLLVMLLAMADMIPGLSLPQTFAGSTKNWVQWLLATPVVLWGGWPFFVRGWRSFMTWKLNMFSLIALGTGAAFAFSVVALLFPAMLPDTFKVGGMTPLYFEAAAVIVTLVLLGQVLELRARSQTNSAIRALLELAPAGATRVRTDGTDEEVALDQVQVGDQLRVKPGAKVPVDGAVVEGRSNIDESMITGEPIPAAKDKGSRVSAGTVNQTGSFVMRADKVGADTLLARIIQTVSYTHLTLPTNREV